MPDITDLNKAFEAFKEEHQKQIDNIKKGFDDIVTQEKLARMEADLSAKQAEFDKAAQEAQVRLDALEAKGNRLNTGHEGQETPEQKQYNASFGQYLRKGTEPLAVKGMASNSDPDGGYLVPVAMANQIIEQQRLTSNIRAYAAGVTISTDSIEYLVDRDEADAAWVGETASRPETGTPTLVKISINVHEQYAEPRVTQKLLDDASVNVEQWLAAKVADKFSRSENTAFVTGDGVSKPRGFLTYPAGTAWGQIEQFNSGASGAFAASNPGDKLIDVLYALKPGYRANATWAMASSLLAAVRKLKDGQGNYLWQPSVQLGQPQTLLGRPIATFEDMPVLAANSLSIAVADFRAAYTIVDRAGIRVIRDPYTAKPYVKFYTTKRVGGDVTDFEAIKLVKFAA